jgi:hypothetical protein
MSPHRRKALVRAATTAEGSEKQEPPVYALGRVGSLPPMNRGDEQPLRRCGLAQPRIERDDGRRFRVERGREVERIQRTERNGQRPGATS